LEDEVSDEPAEMPADEPEAPPEGLEITVELVTPDVGQDLLAQNTINRKLRPKHVNKLAEAMSRGEFRFNGDAIRIADSGNMLDGQHRCEGGQLSGCSFWSVIIRGLPEDVMSTVDTDMAARQLADVLRINREANYRNLGVAITWKWRRDVGLLSTGDLPTVAQALTVLEKNPALRRWVTVARKREYQLIGGNSGQLAALGLEFAAIDAEDADNFFARLASGAELKEGDPILGLRNWLMKRAKQDAKQRAKPYAVYGTVIQAWRHWRNGETKRPVAWNPAKQELPEP
jgi:hypothetical protein